MQQKLRSVLRLAGEGSFLGCYDLRDVQRWLEPCVAGIMAPSKTPMIILAGLNGTLKPADVEEIDDETDVETDVRTTKEKRVETTKEMEDSSSSRRGRRRRVTVPSDVDGTSAVLFEDEETCALTGEPLERFVVLPRRHFADPVTVRGLEPSRT